MTLAVFVEQGVRVRAAGRGSGIGVPVSVFPAETAMAQPHWPRR